MIRPSRWRIWHFMVIVAVLAVVFAIARTVLGAFLLFLGSWGWTVIWIGRRGVPYSVRLGDIARDRVGREWIGKVAGVLVTGMMLLLVVGALILVSWAWSSVFSLFADFMRFYPEPAPAGLSGS